MLIDSAGAVDLILTNGRIYTIDEARPWVEAIAISPEELAEAVAVGISDERFLILPHPEVGDYFQNKAADYDRWIAGMQKLQRSIDGSP